MQNQNKLNSNLNLEKLLEETIKDWNNPKILYNLYKEYITEIEKITEKEFRCRQKAIDIRII